ncbi:MAG: hypothetical protein HZB38_04875 [Planctomycetes bacterium]|nr:hypothetical protein [Planctomycetota bacterium]
MIDVVIFGAGGLGELVADTLRQAGGYFIAGYLDSDPTLREVQRGEFRVFGGFEQIPNLRKDGITHAIVAIGYNAPRVNIAERLVELGLSLASAIHPLASIVEHDNVLGEGVFLHPAARLAGGVTIEEQGTVGIGASVIPGRKVGKGARVHPGAVVIKDVPAYANLVGVPGREIGQRGRFEPEAAKPPEVTAFAT